MYRLWSHPTPISYVQPSHPYHAPTSYTLPSATSFVSFSQPQLHYQPQSVSHIQYSQPQPQPQPEHQIQWSPNRYGTSSVVHHAANTPVAQPVAHAISHVHHDPAPATDHDTNTWYHEARENSCQENLKKLYDSIKDLADTFHISTHGINGAPEAKRVLDQVKHMKGTFQSHAHSSSPSVVPRVLPKVILTKPHPYSTF